MARRSCSEGHGFEWVDASDNEASVISFLRWGREGDPPVLVARNFTPVPRENYRIGVPRRPRDRAHQHGFARRWGAPGSAMAASG
jgi:1,4-alpha-glucan branching enzyme